MTIKKLALAAVMLTASIGANAALELPSNNIETDGEMILTIWNNDDQRALTVDLGVHASDLMKGTLGATTFDLDPADVSWLGTGDIRWNVMGASSSYAEFPAAFGYYFSAKESDTPYAGMGFTEFGSMFDPFQTYAIAVPGMRDTGDYSENLTYRSEGANHAGKGNVWGDNAGNVATFFGFFSATTPDQILNGWIGDFVGSEDYTAAFVHQDVNSWSLDLASNALVYGSGSSYETPVPAAAWLFGSALLGLTGAVRRRRKTA